MACQGSPRPGRRGAGRRRAIRRTRSAGLSRCRRISRASLTSSSKVTRSAGSTSVCWPRLSALSSHAVSLGRSRRVCAERIRSRQSRLVTTVRQPRGSRTSPVRPGPGVGTPPEPHLRPHRYRRASDTRGRSSTRGRLARPPRQGHLRPRDRSPQRPAPSKSPSYKTGRDSTLHRDRHAWATVLATHLRGAVTFLPALPSFPTTRHTKGVDMILITGATGNVGRPLVTQLLARGAKVRAISRNPNTAGLPTEPKSVGADPADRTHSTDALTTSPRSSSTPAPSTPPRRRSWPSRSVPASSGPSRLPPATSTKTTPGNPLAGEATSTPSSSRP